MNELPYLVAATGRILASPSPVLLTHPHEYESALARLRDVFRVGSKGQVFRDLVEAGLRMGMSEAEIVGEWKACERAAPCRELEGDRLYLGHQSCPPSLP